MRLTKILPVALSIAIFGCGKNNDDNAPVKQAYLPATVILSDGGSSMQKYSFHYNKQAVCKEYLL